MKFAPRNDRRAHSALRVAATLLAVAVVPFLLHAAAPSWWPQRGVLTQNVSADDYAPANQGQAKNVARAAAAEMDARLTGGAGHDIHALIDSWSIAGPTTNDFAPINLGQLKSVARVFYDRLISIGLTDTYPWLKSQSMPDDFAVANIGQVKNLFSFDIPAPNILDDSRGDRLAANDSSANLAIQGYAVWIWGDHFQTGSDFERNYPRRVNGLSGVKSVAAGEHHLVALLNDGTVRTWGDNLLGQLGDGTILSRSVPGSVPNLSNIISVKAGGTHTLALQQDGTLLAWGANFYGQLGTGDTNPSSIPILVPGLNSVTKIAAGNLRNLALTSDGTVWTWGYERYNVQDIYNTTPSPVPDLLDVVEIAAGYEHSVVVKADGTVWIWGSNYFDQLGIGALHSAYRDVPVQIPGLSNITKVASSYQHSLALASDGTVWAWGFNSFGQLGDGTNQARPTPVHVTGLTDVIAIATAYSYSLAMKADGTVWVWGDFAPGILPGLNPRLPQQVGLGLFDLNHNGMDDRWEIQYFGNLDQSGDADFDGDGISNRLEYLHGTDPTDYYNGVAPVIEISGGNNQIGSPGTFLAKPFKVRVRKATGENLVNAPVTFTLTNGLGNLAATLGGPLEQTISVRTDSNAEANVYHLLPDIGGISTRTTATAGTTATLAWATFRGISSFSPPPQPTPTPDPSATPSATPDPSATPTATPVAPYRYAIIDLGKDFYPLRINNKGWLLVRGYDSNGNWGSFRWKAGTLERLSYNDPGTDSAAEDINDSGAVAGSFQNVGPWKPHVENELYGALLWPADSANAVKLPAQSAFLHRESQLPGTFRKAIGTAINNQNDVYGEACTGSVWGFLFQTLMVMNGQVWLGGSPSPTQLSFATASNVSSGSFYSNWQGTSDSIWRANLAGHYIGQKTTPIAVNPGFEQGTTTGMIDGQPADFDPRDLNESGIVVGDKPADGTMVIRTLVSPPMAPVADVNVSGTFPIAINDHVRAGQSSPTASPQPTPIPAPQVLSWTGNALVLWELQPESKIWHPFGLEEMIPSMEGWESLDPSDMNNSGLIIGTGWYTDPSYPGAPTELHGFLLVPTELMVDGNRDGQMSFDDDFVRSNDETNEDKPYRFWLNDDDDGGAGDPNDHVLSSIRDYGDGVIRSTRDLEDFSRLHANVNGLAEALEAGTVRAAFEWRQPIGDPRIKIYRATSSTTSYLESETIAASHLLFPFRDTLGEVAPANPLFLPTDFWASRSRFANVPKTLPIAWFIFEGGGEGKGELVLTFWRGNAKIGEAPGVWLDLKNVKRMFQRAKATPLDGVVEPWANENPQPTSYVADPNGYEFEVPPDESDDAIIFVHGIHPPFTAADASYRQNINTAETVYKRLWHSGYKGRLAFYKWPALNPAGYFLNGSGFEFNQSEYRAFKYGKGLVEFVASLPATCKKHVYAHSQGNAVAAAAFRNYGLKAKTWIVTQGAIPISCFDSDLRHYVFDYVTPDSASDLGYRGFLDDHVQTRIVNFCNNQDTVTGKIWELNHEFFKPTVHVVGLLARVEYWYFANPSEVHLKQFLGNVELSDRGVNDPHESMSMAVKSRTRSIAHRNDVHGKVDETVDLHSVFDFGDQHGSQWELPIQRGAMDYFKRLVDETR